MDAILVTGQSNARISGAFLQTQFPEMQIVNSAVGGSKLEDWQKGMIHYNAALQTVNGEFGIGSLARDDLFCSFQSAWHLTCHCSCSFYLSILETNSPQFQLTYL